MGGTREQCRRKDPFVQRGLVNPEGVHRPNTFSHVGLSSIPRERYVRELALTVLSSKELQREKHSRKGNRIYEGPAPRSPGQGSRARQKA